MARLFGIIGNRPDLTARVLASEADALRARSAGSAPNQAPLGWGIGFFQGGEVLMRRRPIDERTELDVASLAADVRADLLLGHVRYATVGALRTENTHPFRYRQWLFAQTGTVPEFERIRDRVVASVPDFLRSGIRGETDAEAVFHVFLSFLHDGGLLGDVTADPAVVRDALRSSLAVIDGMTVEVGAEAAKVNLLVSNGDRIIAVHRSDAPMRLRIYSGKVDAELIMGDDAHLRRKVPEIGRMHFTVVASDFDDAVPNGRWKAVADSALVTMSRDDDPRVEAL
ncbi:MAG TPA: class II glutamine amidotransferase [Polyangiaceae bacterium]|nr:class II glutamine amidotransferase [Polyangiaceae bacterium]